MAQAERLYWMDGIMQGKAYLHWQTVVDKFEVQRRTVFNDMRFLRDRLGAPVAFSRRFKGWHYTSSNYQIPFLALSDGEAATLRRTLLAALPDDLLADVRHAIDDRHRLRLTYYSAHRDQLTERVIRPYRLLNRGGELYLIGHCELRDATRDFGLHRIKERTVLDPPRAFAVPESFDIEAYLETACGLKRYSNFSGRKL